MRRSVLVALVILLAVAVAGAAGAVVTRSPSPSDSGQQAVPAPIDKIDVQVIGRTASARISAGLPSGCARIGSHSVARSGDTFTVTVLNRMPTGDPICTAIYGMYEVTVDLATDLVPGTTYTVRVNDKTTTFKA